MMPREPSPTADSGSVICKWAKSHDGQTCAETGASPAYWCLVCKRASLSPNDGLGAEE